eukprot:CAMPEP_0114684278 /NCGR_PEP_ID=MMETSP0191-20121206/58906_1 /TAXON_ID=126664 /ORGANISM="Sorites sp." /LENGTH=70 /DNA_ID=CAMNT_0001966777 /DNA_START=394 /DNA_END=606 /DNA_ORIENTATION=+
MASNISDDDDDQKLRRVSQIEYETKVAKDRKHITFDVDAEFGVNMDEFPDDDGLNGVEGDASRMDDSEAE